jgi:hypothetical protein
MTQAELGFEKLTPIQSLTINHLIPTPSSQIQPPIEMTTVARKVSLNINRRI